MQPTIAHWAILAVVTAAAMTDLATGKIHNKLTAPALVFGLALGAAGGGWSGLGASLLGCAVGLVPFFVLYALGGLGGGDVKLMAAVGAIGGYPFVLNAMISAVLVGGLIAFLIVTWEGRLGSAVRFLATTAGRVVHPGLRPARLESREAVPFGVAICLGSFLTLAAIWLGYASPSQLIVAGLGGG